MQTKVGVEEKKQQHKSKIYSNNQPNRGEFAADKVGLPRIGVWVMPDNILPGHIEDFGRLLIDSDDLLIPIAVQVLDRLVQESIQRFRPVHRSKALLHTWLAWQDPPGLPIGTAITAKALNPDYPTASAFVDWIQRLFMNPLKKPSFSQNQLGFSGESRRQKLGFWTFLHRSLLLIEKLEVRLLFYPKAANGSTYCKPNSRATAS